MTNMCAGDWFACTLQVDGFGDLTSSIEQILRTVCTDVSLQKTVSATNVTVGGNVTYELSV